MPLYCLDTSALIHAAVRAYPFEMFPSFWDKLDNLIEQERAIIPIAAFDELEKKTDEVHEWVKSRDKMIVAIDTKVQEIVREILADKKCRRLVDTKKGRSGADPFVIALAEVTDSIVVTQEIPVGIQAKSPRIPDVCKERGVQWMDLLDLIQTEKWVF